MTRAFETRRADTRARLDNEPDVVVSDGQVVFQHAFETIEDSETFCYAPADVVDAGRRLLMTDAADGISVAVHDTVVVRVGCNCVPVFAAVNGGRGRGLFSFKCVYPDCSAFLDVRVLQHVDVVKWVLMGVSHTLDFSTFPPRLPRNTFRGETMEAIRRMVMQNHSSAEIRMTNNVLCNTEVIVDGVFEQKNSGARGLSRWLRLRNKLSRKQPIVFHIDCFVQFL